MEQRFSDLIILLASGINQRRMYFDDHPKVRAFSRDFTIQLADLLKEEAGSEFAFGVFNGKFVRKGKYLVGPSIAGRSLIAMAETLKCGGFVFRLPIEPEDLITFFRLGAGLKEPPGDIEASRRLFASQGIGHIGISPPFTENGGRLGPAGTEAAPAPEESQEDMLGDDFAPLMEVYQSLYDLVAVNSELTHRGRDADIDGARAVGERLVRTGGDGVMDVMQFIRYPDYDSYTIGHSVRVAALSVVVGRKLGLSEEIVGELASAGLLHDLGKGKVPDEILFKPDKLDAAERAVMESHPALGAQMLIAGGDASELVVSAAWGHHIRHDGGGYPRMPAWHRRSFAAAIVHVCDVFEALTATRPYKAPLSPRRAYQIMFGDRGAYAPQPLAALVLALGLYPPGSEIMLSDGRRAVVTSPGPDLDNPRVRVTHDQIGRPLAAGSRPLLDIGRESGVGVSEIFMIGAEAD